MANSWRKGKSTEDKERKKQRNIRGREENNGRNGNEIQQLRNGMPPDKCSLEANKVKVDHKTKLEIYMKKSQQGQKKKDFYNDIKTGNHS